MNLKNTVKKYITEETELIKKELKFFVKNYQNELKNTVMQKRNNKKVTGKYLKKCIGS